MKAKVLIYVVAILLALAILTAKVWVIGSVIQSSTKSLSGDCGKVYKGERFFNGNFFCSDK